MRPVIRPLAILVIILAVPTVPFLILGDQFVNQIASWRHSPQGSGTVAAAVVAILASDIVLPVPSSMVNTLAGAHLGIVAGTVVCWLGMTAGSVAAFALVRHFGRPLALRLASPTDLERMEGACRDHDVWMLLVTRPLPILAEACVLLLGLLAVPWRRFLVAVAASNLVIAASYATLGRFASDHQWLPTALCLSLAVPVLLATWARRRGR